MTRSTHQQGALWGIIRRILSVKEVGIFLILLLMVVAISLDKPSFSTRSNAVSILQAISPVAIMAIGQTFVILTAGIDLSVGSVCALSAYFMTLVLTGESGYPLWLGILTALGTGTVCGFLSGLLITKVRVTPFIVTLGMLSACSGLTLGLSGGKQIGLNKFGQAQEVRDSILSPAGEISGRPEVQRKFYSDSGETSTIIPTKERGAWIGVSGPGHVYLLDKAWKEIAGCAPELETIPAMVRLPDGSVLVAGKPGGKVWRVTTKGEKSLYFDTGAKSVGGLLAVSGGRLWISTDSPGKVWLLDQEKHPVKTFPVVPCKAFTSIAEGPGESVYLSCANPGMLVHIGSRDEPKVLYRSENSRLGNLKRWSDGSLFFTEGGKRPTRLMVFRNGDVSQVWETPKPPIRDYLLFDGGVILVSTGNMGSIYLVRPNQSAIRIHPMTRFKARVLARQEDESSLLVGNAGPAGLSTMTTMATKTVYPVAESFNSLFVWAPWTMAVLVVLAGLFLKFTAWGMHLYAIGGNETAARLSGVQVDQVKIFAYSLTGLLSGLAAVFMTSKLHTLDPNLAKGYELKVIAAVVIGGTSLMGGEGSVWGTLLGACLLYVLNYALVHLGMEDIWSDLFVGVVIILAAVIDSTRTRLPEITAFIRRRFFEKP